MTDFYDVVGTDVDGSGGTHSAPSPRADMDDRIYIDRGETERTNSKRSWAESDGKFWTTPFSHEELPAGLYRMQLSDNVGPLFVKQSNDTDQLIHLPDSESSKVVDEIVKFKDLREKFSAAGLLYKRGIMLYGPPGSGKTCTLQFIVQLLISKHNSIAVVVERPSLAATCLQSLRRIESKRQIIAIMEDLDALVERYGESEYLALIDGESQIDNIVFIATTNYPEKLDKRFVDRPSRFDTIRYIGMPNENSRRHYFKSKVLNVDTKTLNKYVKVSEGFSIAHLRELVILTQCFDQSIEEAAQKLKDMQKKLPSSTKAPDAPEFGFAPPK